MESWFVPDQMKQLSNKVVKNYGYDNQGIADYSFNNLGFRSPGPGLEDRLVVIGNSISFGIGLNIEYTYGAILANNTKRQLDNRSLGCFLHENHDQLNNIRLLSKENCDSIFIVQINNLDRRRDGTKIYKNNDARWCVNQFLDFFDQTEYLLKYIPHKYIYWDNVEYSLPPTIEKMISIKNKFHLDCSLIDNSTTFGLKSHHTISKVLNYII